MKLSIKSNNSAFFIGTVVAQVNFLTDPWCAKILEKIMKQVILCALAAMSLAGCASTSYEMHEIRTPYVERGGTEVFVDRDVAAPHSMVVVPQTHYDRMMPSFGQTGFLTGPTEVPSGPVYTYDDRTRYATHGYYAPVRPVYEDPQSLSHLQEPSTISPHYIYQQETVVTVVQTTDRPLRHRRTHNRCTDLKDRDLARDCRG